MVELPLELASSSDQVIGLIVNLELFYFPADLEKLQNVGGRPLSSFNSHIIVHSFLHEGALSKSLGLVGDDICVQAL